MTKKELVAELADRAGLTKAAAEDALNKLTEIILDRAQAGLDTQIHGFGIFSRKDRPARKGRNPSTGQAMDLPATSVLGFKPSKTTRDLLA